MPPNPLENIREAAGRIGEQLKRTAGPELEDLLGGFGSRPMRRRRCGRAMAKGTHAMVVATSSAPRKWSGKPPMRTAAPTACISPVRHCGRRSETDVVVVSEPGAVSQPLAFLVSSPIAELTKGDDRR